MQTLTNEAIEQAAAMKGKKALVALANAHNIDAKGTAKEITSRLQDALYNMELEEHSKDDGLDIPPFLQRKADEQQPEAKAPEAPATEEPAQETAPAAQDDAREEAPEVEPFAVLPLETAIAGEAVLVFQIELGEGKYAGPFDTEEQAIAFRDKHFATRTKTGRKRSIAKTAGEPGKMTDGYRKKTVTLVTMPGDGEHLTRQAEGCLEALRAMIMDLCSAEEEADIEGQSVTQGALVDYLIADAQSSRSFINTTQSPKRIWDFYRKTLVEGGYVTVE